jgi:subtilisin family serine protease
MDDEQGLGVAALDESDVKADFSNFSDRLAISAPGDATDGPIDPETMIISARPDGTYAGWAGTSFAVPFVSGAAAIVRGQNPHWPAGFDTYLQVKAVLQGTAVNIYPQNPEFADEQELGAGRLDIGAAAAQSPVAPVPGDITGGPGDPSPPDGFVDVQDLLAMLEQWGETHSSADLDLNGSVDVGDLLILLANWT